MTAVVRQAIIDRRKELHDHATLLASQLEDVLKEVDSRQVELSAVQADVAALDAWLAANP